MQAKQLGGSACKEENLALSDGIAVAAGLKREGDGGRDAEWEN